MSADLSSYQKVARWRKGDEVSYQRGAFTRWHHAKILDVFLEGDHALYRVSVDGKIYLALERQLGYPTRRNK